MTSLATGNPLGNPLKFFDYMRPLLLLNRGNDVQFAMQIVRESGRCERLEDGGFAGLMVGRVVYLGVLGRVAAGGIVGALWSHRLKSSLDTWKSTSESNI